MAEDFGDLDVAIRLCRARDRHSFQICRLRVGAGSKKKLDDSGRLVALLYGQDQGWIPFFIDTPGMSSTTLPYRPRVAREIAVAPCWSVPSGVAPPESRVLTMLLVPFLLAMASGVDP